MELFDEILYGPAPESLVEDTHWVIRELLISSEGRIFIRRADSTESNGQEMFDNFIRWIISAVPPIVPGTRRKKSLDRSYFMTALHKLGAAELLFS